MYGGMGATSNQSSEVVRRRRSLDIPRTRSSRASKVEQPHSSSPTETTSSNGVQHCADSLTRRRVTKGQTLSTASKARFTSFGSGSELGFSFSDTPHDTQISSIGNSDRPEQDKVLKATLCSTGPHTQHAGDHHTMEQGAKVSASFQGSTLAEPTSPHASGAGVEIFFFHDQQAGPVSINPQQSSTQSSQMMAVPLCQALETPLQPSLTLVKQLSFALPVKPAEVLFIDSDHSSLPAPPVPGLNETKARPGSESWSFAHHPAHGAETDEAGSSGTWQLLGNTLVSTEAAAELKAEAAVPQRSSRANRNSVDSLPGDAKCPNQVDKIHAQDWCHPARPSRPALGLSSLRRSQSGIPAGYGAPSAPTRSTCPLSHSPLLPSERPMSSGGRTSRFAKEELRALLGESRGLPGHNRGSSLTPPLKTQVTREHRPAFSLDGAAGDILQGSSLLPSRSPLKSARVPSTSKSSTTSIPSASRSSPALVSKSPLRYTGSNSRQRVSIEVSPTANPEINEASTQLVRPLPNLPSACSGVLEGNTGLGIPGRELGSALSASGLGKAPRGGAIMKRPERQNSLPSFVGALASVGIGCESEQSTQDEAMQRGEEKDCEGKPLSFEAAFSRCCKLENDPSTGDSGSPSRSPSTLKPILVLRQEGLQHARSLGRRVRFKKRVDVVIFS